MISSTKLDISREWIDIVNPIICIGNYMNCDIQVQRDIIYGIASRKTDDVRGRFSEPGAIHFHGMLAP